MGLVQRSLVEKRVQEEVKPREIEKVQAKSIITYLLYTNQQKCLKGANSSHEFGHRFTFLF